MPEKVIVVGAGVSGLLAAHLLKEKEVEVEIVEASSRWGGRIKDADKGFADFPVALGAEWCHSLQVFEAADLYGCLACFFADMELHTADCPIFKDITEGQCAEPEGKIFHDKVADLNLLSSDGKVVPADEGTKHFFNVPGDNKFHNSSWVTVFEKRVLPSVKDSITYDCPVTEINYEGEKVTIKTATGKTFEADKVVVCVPISILKKDFIKFSPSPPPEKMAAIAQTKTTPGLKLFLEFSHKFYPHFLLMQSMSSDGYYMYMDETVGKTTEKHILCLVVLGEGPYEAVTANGDSNDNVKDFSLAQLDQIFDGKASSSYVNCIVQNWQTEPFIEQGGPDCHDATAEHQKALASPLDGKVFFAGDCMNPDPMNNLYVQGACETAYIAVKAMLP